MGGSLQALRSPWRNQDHHTSQPDRHNQSRGEFPEWSPAVDPRTRDADTSSRPLGCLNCSRFKAPDHTARWSNARCDFRSYGHGDHRLWIRRKHRQFNGGNFGERTSLSAVQDLFNRIQIASNFYDHVRVYLLLSSGERDGETVEAVIVDDARNPTAPCRDVAHCFRCEQRRTCVPRNLQPPSNVSRDFLAGKRLDLHDQREPLAKLQELGAGNLLCQLRLTREDNLHQLALRVFKVRQKADGLEHRSAKVLCFIHHDHYLPPGTSFLQ